MHGRPVRTTSERYAVVDLMRQKGGKGRYWKCLKRVSPNVPMKREETDAHAGHTPKKQRDSITLGTSMFYVWKTRDLCKWWCDWKAATRIDLLKGLLNSLWVHMDLHMRTWEQKYILDTGIPVYGICMDIWHEHKWNNKRHIEKIRRDCNDTEYSQHRLMISVETRRESSEHLLTLK